MMLNANSVDSFREITPEKGIKRAKAADELIRPIVDEFLEANFSTWRESLIARTDKAISERLGQIPSQQVEIVQNAEVIQKLNRQHYLFPAIIKLMTAQDRYGNFLNLALVGPTGTGKTKACINVAEALKLEFILQPFNPQTTKSDLMGYMDASGNYIASPFYRAFKQGKLFIADEFDAANPAVTTILNAAVSNRVITFPNGENVTAHSAFRAVYCMNTFGTGGDDRYTGRNRLDMATLDRLVYLQFPIDPGLEAALIGIVDVASPPLELEEGGRFKNEREILNKIVSIRGAVESNAMRYSISPRAVIHADAMHRAGFGISWILKCCVFAGMPQADRTKLLRNLNLN